MNPPSNKGKAMKYTVTIGQTEYEIRDEKGMLISNPSQDLIAEALLAVAYMDYIEGASSTFEV